MRFLALLIKGRPGRIIGVVLVAMTLGASLAAAPESAVAARTVSLVSIGSHSGGGPGEPWSEGVSSDGQRLIFATHEQLVPADTDLATDLYERRGEVTTLISVGPDGGNGEAPAHTVEVSVDAARVFFVTAEPLVVEDEDAQNDVYERAGGATRLISVGPDGGNGAFPVTMGGITPDGGAAFFMTEEPLLAADTDAKMDVYRLAGTVLRRLSLGPNGGNGEMGSTFLDASDDGAHAFIWTNEQLVADDTDIWYDAYERSAGQTTRVTTGPLGGNGPHNASLVEVSSDGSRALFTTVEPMVATDTDTVTDLYERHNGETTLLSAGPTGGNGSLPVIYAGASTALDRVFFETEEALVGADADADTDVYELHQGETTLVSAGSSGGNGPYRAAFVGASEDGSRVFFETLEPLLPSDEDEAEDIYERAEGELRHVSIGPAGGNGPIEAGFVEASADGGAAFFQTDEPLVSEDVDAADDVYMRAGPELVLISAGPGEEGSFLERISADGSHAYFWTENALDVADSDGTGDIYLSLPASPPPPATDPAQLVAPPSAEPFVPTPAGPPVPFRCKGARATLIGTARSETLRGGDKRDVIVAFGGADRIFASGGNDLVCAGAGNDLVRGGAGRDTIHGEAGGDRLFGGEGPDLLRGGPGGDSHRE